MALQWREPQNTIKPAKTLGEILIQLTLNYASPKLINKSSWSRDVNSG